MNTSSTFGPEIGEAPGDVPVVSDDDVRNPRQGYASDIIVSRREMCLVPSIRQTQIKMHVVGQQRLSGRCVCTGDDPVVGAGMELVVCEISAIERVEEGKSPRFSKEEDSLWTGQ